MTIAFFVCSGLSIVLLFAVMIMSSMASTAASSSPDSCQSDCKKYSTYSAVTTGLATLFAIGGVVLYIYVGRETQ